MKKQNSNESTVKRFSKAFIISHWVNAFAFFALYITALPLYTDFFNWLYPVFGGPEMARLLHRIFAVLFIVPLFLLIIFDFAGFKNWAKNILKWEKKDFQFLMAFPKEFFLGKSKVPKQDFFNAGEKLNSLLTIMCTLMLIGSGFVMWFPGAFASGVVQWAYPIHNIGFGLALAVVVGHIFLSIGHPNSKASMRGMTKGDVPISYAKEHHGVWYDEMVKKGEIKEEKDKSKGA
ncbi:formate dehydrogenase subunit gamma [Evansella clarkii]|uniref:formate dehydrogenase subunit gamma n=1 Tax=Evansella clarkii TaxID=79879 RepID=UPI00099893CD|nr:cytochrome b/b6 domain-containing protein [Evansella clarkii]